MLVLSLSFTVGGHGQCERRGRLLNVTGSSKSTVYFNTESSLSGEKKKQAKPNQKHKQANKHTTTTGMATKNNNNKLCNVSATKQGCMIVACLWMHSFKILVTG